MLFDVLTRLEQADLIRHAQFESEPTYVFRHILVQDTTYESLLKNDRKLLHAFVAKVLEREYAGELNELALPLARHWDEAGEAARAFTYYVLAGDNAAQVYANFEALTSYERALELARALELPAEEREHLYANRGRVRELRGEYEAALENYQDEERWAQGQGDKRLELDALVRRATLFVTPSKLFDLDTGLELCNQALELARATGNRPAEAKVLWNLLLLYQFTGDHDRAIQYGEASLALARTLDLREQMAFTLNDLVRVYIFTGRMGEGWAAQAEAEMLWRELDNLPMLADNLSNEGLYSFLFGDYRVSIPQVEEALRLSQEIGNLWGEAYAREILGMMYLERCELAQALSFMQRGAELAAKIGFHDAQCAGTSSCGLVYSELGAPETGISALEQLVTDKSFAPEWLVGPYASLSMLYCDLGDIARTKIALAAAERALTTNVDPISELFVNLARVRLHLAIGEAEKAYQNTRAGLELLEANGVYPFKTLELYYQGRALHNLGRLDEATAVLETAEREAEVTERKTFLWQIQALLAQLHRERGDRTAADAFAQSARASAQFIAEHAPPELRDTFLNRPDVRAVLASANPPPGAGFVERAERL